MRLDATNFNKKESNNDKKNLNSFLKVSLTFFSRFVKSFNLNFVKGGACKGQLTTFGEQEMYQLGRRIRHKYNQELKFLSSDYNPNEI